MLETDALAPPVPDVSDPSVHVWWDDLQGVPCAYGHTVDGEHWMHVPRVASFRFSGTSEEVSAIPHPMAEPEFVQDVYYHSVLPMALQALGQEGLHASGIRMGQGVVAFCAVKGTG